MQENKEHHRTGITEAIAEDAIHIMEGDGYNSRSAGKPQAEQDAAYVSDGAQHIRGNSGRAVHIVHAAYRAHISLLERTEIRGVYTGRRGIRRGSYSADGRLAQKPRLKGDAYAIHVRGAVCAAGVQLPSGKSLIKRIMERDG